MTAPPKSEREIFAMFDSLARVYDLLNRLLSFNRDAAWRRRLAEMCLTRISCQAAPGGGQTPKMSARGSDAVPMSRCPDVPMSICEGSDARASRRRPSPKPGSGAACLTTSVLHARGEKCGLTRSDARVLDVCCGTGDLLIEFARRLDRRGFVCGLDFSPAMIARMRKKIAARSFKPRIASEIADALRMPFDDDSFDTVACAFGVRNIPDRRAALAEMARVLKPGGVLGILEFVRPERLSRVERIYLRKIVPLAGRIFLRTRRNPYQYLADSIEGFITAENLKDELCLTGLKDVKYVLDPPNGGFVAFHSGTK